MMNTTDKLTSLALVLLSVVLLLPGVTLPVMTLTGTLDRAGMVDLGQQAVVDARVQKALQKNPDKDEATLRHRKARTVRFLSGLMDLDEVSGRVEVYRKSSSVLETVQTLISKGYPAVAGLVALFSVVIPLFKNSLLVAAVLLAGRPLGQRLAALSAAVAKWSMADVFLVSLFVGFLAFNATSALDGVLELNAVLENGFYWFTGYCLVSLLTGQVLLAKISAMGPTKTKRAPAKKVAKKRAVSKVAAAKSPAAKRKR